MGIEKQSNIQPIENSNSKGGIDNNLDTQELKLIEAHMIRMEQQLHDRTLILNYSISPNGKYNYFVNNIVLDIPLNLSQFTSIGNLLVILLNKIEEVELEYDWFEPKHYVDIQVDKEGLLGSIGLDDNVLGTETMRKLLGREGANNNVRKIYSFIQSVQKTLKKEEQE